MELLARPGDFIAGNTLFDTTRAHVLHRGAKPLDLVGDCLWEFDVERPFKGNVDLEMLQTALEKHHERMPFVVLTIVNNMAGSSPVSMANIREAKRLADRYSVPLLFDAARFAENAFLIKQREPGYADKSVLDIAREIFSFGHGCWMSAKKDGLVNIGGFIALNDEKLANRCRERLVLYEGFPTYGGLARRDLEAMAIGLEEGISEAHLRQRVAQVAYLGELLQRAGMSVSRPTGGSGVFVDVGSLYGHLSPERLPCVALTCDLYLEGGVRAAAAPFNLTRLDVKTAELAPRVFEIARFAVPRRVYGQSQMDYVGLVAKRVKQKAPTNPGYQLVHEPEVLGHFFTKFAPLNGGPPALG
jgi:tryptophanase